MTENSSTSALTLSNTGNTFAGQVAVNSGTLNFSTVGATATSAQQLGENASLTVGVAGTSSGTLNYTGGAGNLAKAISALGNGSDTIKNSGSGLLTLSGGLAKNGTKLTLNGGSHGINVTTNGITGSSAGSDLLVTGGLTEISVASTYNGPTTVYGGGTLENGIANALPTGTTLNMGSATLESSSNVNNYNLNGNNQTVAGITSTNGSSGTDTNTIGSTTAATLTVTPSGSDTYAGVLGGSGQTSLALTMGGTGTLTLSGANTYTGATQVNSGILSVTGSLASGSTVTVGGSTATVSSTPTLNGTGTVSGNVIVASVGGGAAGTISPGTSSNLYGTLTVGGTISFQTGSVFALNMSGASSTGELIIGGAATIGTGADISIAVGTTLSGSSYVLATAASGLNSGTPFTVLGSLPTGYQLVYTGTALDLNQITVTNGKYTLTTTAGSLNVHANGGTTALSTTFTNTGTGTQDALNYNSLTATGTGVGSAGGTTSGSNIAQGASGSGSATNTFTAGSSAGNVAISNLATVSNATASGTPVATNNGATINVYSGLSTWNTNGGGSWSTAGTGAYGAGANWGANQGAPGVTAGFANTDTATFDNTALAHNSSATVTLDGATPSLKAITFNTDPNSGYTIATGTPNTGSIALDGNGGNATVTVTSGTHVISAPVSLTTSATINVGSVSAVAQQLTVSGQISGNGGLSNTGSGNTIVTLTTSTPAGPLFRAASSMSTTRGALRTPHRPLRANRTITPSNSTGSGTGTGSVTVNSGGTLAGSGTIASSTAGVTVNNGGTLASGGIQSGTSAGVGLTINSNLSSALIVNGGATLTFALGSTTAYNGGSGALNFGNPNTNSTFLSLTGTTVDQIFSNTTTADNIDLVDLTNGSMSVSLTLRSQNPYLLIQTALGNNQDFSNVWTTGGEGANGYVLGISTGVGNAYTAFNLAAYDINGNQINTSTNLQNLRLYLYNGRPRSRAGARHVGAHDWWACVADRYPAPSEQGGLNNPMSTTIQLLTKRSGRRADRGFSLVEMLVVISIVSVLSVLVTAGLQGVLGSTEDGQISDIANTLMRARTYAMANNTYVFVGIQEVSAANPSSGSQTPGTGRIGVVVMATNDGSRGYQTSISTSTTIPTTSGTQLVSVSPLRHFDNLHLLTSTGINTSTLPNNSTSGLGRPIMWPVSHHSRPLVPALNIPPSEIMARSFNSTRREKPKLSLAPIRTPCFSG